MKLYYFNLGFSTDTETNDESIEIHFEELSLLTAKSSSSELGFFYLLSLQCAMLDKLL